MKYYLTFKDIVKMVRKGKKRIIHCNDCHYDVKYNSFMDDFNIKCIHCGNNQLEVWDEKHCPKCGEEMQRWRLGKEFPYSRVGLI